MGRPNKGSSLTEKAFDNYSSSDYLAGFENGGSTHKYNIGNVSKYALEKQTLSAGGKSGTVKTIIDGLTPRIKKTEDDIAAFETTVAEAEAAVSELSGRVNAMESGPLVAATSSAMVDTTRIYVYTGEELGMTSGNWYYHNGTNWVSGGPYNAVAVNTDDTLSVEDVPADAKAVGDALSAMDEQKANVDGVYESMTVGNAEQLIGSVFTEDDMPYNFRTAGGAIDIGDRLYDKLVGGTVAWNQLQKNTVSRTDSDITYTFSNGKLSVTGTATASSWWLPNGPGYAFEFYSGHKYLIEVGNQNYDYSINTDYYFYISESSNIQIMKPSSIINMPNNRVASLQFRIASGVEIDEEFWPQIFDLTQMFGSAIADYIYSLEQTTEGAGVAWFRKLFPKPYYPYNAGELMSVQTSAHKTVGFNAWDEEWEVGQYKTENGVKHESNVHIRCKNPIPVTPNTKYHFNTNGFNIHACFLDADLNFINGFHSVADVERTTPENCRYIVFNMAQTYGTYYNNDICINLSWDGERDGEYEEYVEHVYPLDSNLTLRGIPKLDASNKLYYDGDTYESDGTVKRKYGIVDLGDFIWYATTANGYPVFYCASSNSGTPYRAFNILCSKYSDASAIGAADKTIIGYGTTSGSSQYSRIGIRDDSCSEMTGSEFRTAVTGVYALVELAEPTEETAAPYQNPQVVDDFGTEEYVDSRTVPIPVGHETKYANNLRAKLEMAPDSPDGNGDYIVRHTNGENEYTPLVIPKELPNTPSEDGIYHLKVTVVNGAAGLSWESEA